MRTLIKLIVILAIIVGLAYAGVRGFVWLSVKKEVDKTIKSVAPFAAVTYKSIYSSPKLDGTVGVDGIVIKPNMFNDEIKVKSIRLSLPGVWSLVSAGRNLKKEKQMPDEMELSITGLSADLNGQLMTTLSQMQKQAAAIGKQESFPLENIDAMGCGDVKSIGIEELTQMGFDTMDVDLDMGYKYDRLHNKVELNMKGRTKGMFSIDLTATMMENPDSVLRGKIAAPILDSMTLQYVDNGFYPARNKFCAAHLNTSVDGFIINHVVTLSRVMHTTFPPGTIEAYKTFLKGGGHIEITLAPESNVDLSTLGAYKPKDVIDMLGLKLTIINYPVNFNQFGWGKQYAKSDISMPDAKPATTVVETPSLEPEHRPASYHRTPAWKLGQYVGSKVKIRMINGVKREGEIEGGSNDTVIIRMIPEGGKGFITATIPFGDIVYAEVLY